MKWTVEMMEEMVGRKLSESEAQTVQWLAGWERESQQNLLMLMMSYGAKCWNEAKEKYQDTSQ